MISVTCGNASNPWIDQVDSTEFSTLTRDSTYRSKYPIDSGVLLHMVANGNFDGAYVELSLEHPNPGAYQETLDDARMFAEGTRGPWLTTGATYCRLTVAGSGVDTSITCTATAGRLL